MQIDKFFIGVVVFLVFIVAGTMMLTDLETNYEGVDGGVDLSVDKYLGNITTIANNDRTFNTSSATHDKILGGQVDDDSTEDSMFKGGFSALRLITTPVDITKTIISETANSIGIDKIFVSYAFAAFMFAVVFAIILLIFRIRG